MANMVLALLFCNRAKARSRKQMVAQESEKIAAGLEAQRMHASNIYTKTDGKETLRPLIWSKQPRPLAEIVDWARKENTCLRMAENE